VVDTRRRTRERYRVPRDCTARFEQGQRAFAGDRLVLRCGRVPRYGAVILNVATRSVSPLPTELAGVDPGTPRYWFIGRNWVYGEGRCSTPRTTSMRRPLRRLTAAGAPSPWKYEPSTIPSA
jgi:hypothetical protein